MHVQTGKTKSFYFWFYFIYHLAVLGILLTHVSMSVYDSIAIAVVPICVKYSLNIAYGQLCVVLEWSERSAGVCTIFILFVIQNMDVFYRS